MTLPGRGAVVLARGSSHVLLAAHGPGVPAALSAHDAARGVADIDGGGMHRSEAQRVSDEPSLAAARAVLAAVPS